MAISKIVYKSSPSATPVTWMDVTQKTVTSGTMLNGTTALKNDGTDITGSIASKTSSNLSASGATVTAEAGYYASNATKTVASGTEGTPTATKGTVSNHSVMVTPSVTNTAGYISGGTHTGTAVTVSASELASGNKSITENGTDIDVVGYSTVSVSVGGGGSLPRLLHHEEITPTTTATSSNKLYVNLDAATDCLVYVVIDTLPSQPDASEYIALCWAEIFTSYGNGAQYSAILRPAGTVGTDGNMCSFNTSTGVFSLGGSYGHFMAGTKYHVYQFEIGSAT